jgi:hypothetical protein
MNMIVHPVLASKIASAINSRAVAAEMIDVTLKAKPYVHDNFLFWIDAHREASGTLGAMGINVITYEEQPK